MFNILFEHKTLFSFLFSFRKLEMAASSVNVNLSAKLDLCLSLTLLFPSCQVVEVGEGSNAAAPVNCIENFALTDVSIEREVESEPEGGSLIDANASIGGGVEPIPSCSRDLTSDSHVEGPLSEPQIRALKAKFEKILGCVDSPELLISPPSAPLPTPELPLLPLSLSFPTNSMFVNVDSPESPSFLSINPNDLFWTPLPFVDENMTESIVELVGNKDGEIVIEMEGVDDDVVFLGEFRKS